MTRTPHLHALAMRTKAARIADNVSRGQYHMDDAPIAIIALPLEADHAALIREAARLIIAKWDADIANGIVYGPNEFAVLVRALALETP